MNDINRIINECGLSKVNISKFLGVSRQMLYNYLALKKMDEIPKEKKNKLLKLFGVEKESDLSKIKIDTGYLDALEARLNEGITDNLNNNSIVDFKGLSKKQQEILLDIYNLLKEKLLTDNKNDSGYETLRYLYYYIQTMEQVEELKYILVYMAKSNCIVPPLEFIYDENKQYTFEGILYSALMLYNTSITTGGGAAKSKVSESHKKFEQEIESKKEEKLSRTQELNSFKTLALNELGYTSINESNAKEVFEKIAEIMSRKF